MNIEERIASESRKLSDFYYPYYMEKRYPGAMNDFSDVNTKYWQNKIFFSYKKWFERAARMFCIREQYNAEKLIQAFLLDGFKYPQQLGVEQVWNTYIKYLPGLHTKKDKEKEIVENLVGAILEVKRRGKVKDWLNLKINQNMVLAKEIKFDPTILAFSYSFIEFCDKNKLDYNLEEMRKNIFDLNSSKKIIDKIKSFLEDDYYLYDEELSEQLAKDGIVF